jgi:CubicO group peptidase (beta-lactamase class C family)
MSRLGPPSFSTAKSFVSALIGAAIADGSITSVDDPVIKFITQIAGRGLDSKTIRNLLLMNSGIRYEYNSQLPFYRHPFGDDSLTYYSPDMRKPADSLISKAVRAFMKPGQGSRTRPRDISTLWNLMLAEWETAVRR